MPFLHTDGPRMKQTMYMRWLGRLSAIKSYLWDPIHDLGKQRDLVQEWIPSRRYRDDSIIGSGNDAVNHISCINNSRRRGIHTINIVCFADCLVQLVLWAIVGRRERCNGELDDSLTLMNLPCFTGFSQIAANWCCVLWLRVHSIDERKGMTSCCSLCEQHLNAILCTTYVVIRSDSMTPIYFNF
jgi:hypothetical protein